MITRIIGTVNEAEYHHTDIPRFKARIFSYGSNDPRPIYFTAENLLASYCNKYISSFTEIVLVGLMKQTDEMITVNAHSIKIL